MTGYQLPRQVLATFTPHEGIEFNGVDNKDADIFPIVINDPNRQTAMAMLNRPLLPHGPCSEKTMYFFDPHKVDFHRKSI